MKKKWKQINRGIILSGIVLTIMALYITIDYMKFQKQKDTIKETVTEYIDAMYKVNVSNTNDKKQLQDKISDLVNQYWSDDKGSVKWATTKLNMQSDIRTVFEADNFNHVISEADSSIKKITVKKGGPGVANISIEYSAKITGKENSFFFTPSACRELNSEYEPSPSDDTKNQISGLKSGKDAILSYSAEATIELVSEKGVWKISNFNGYETSSSFNYVESK